MHKHETLEKIRMIHKFKEQHLSLDEIKSKIEQEE